MSFNSEAGLQEPLIITVPGIDNSGPGHWQSIWEGERANVIRADLGQWTRPHRNSWVTKLNLAIRTASRPVVLVAHSLGCHAVAWWAQLERPQEGQVLGALLVAPPEVDGGAADRRLLSFGPTPKSLLPFPSIVVASRNDRFISFDRARRLADFWGARFADAGHAGHINADEQLGDWPQGKALLDGLIDRILTPAKPIANALRHPVGLVPLRQLPLGH